MEFNATFLATIITFIIFVFVMNKILYKPVLSIMEERKNLIDTNYKAAENNNKMAESINDQINEGLEHAKNDARAKYNESVNSYKHVRDEKLSGARSEASETLRISRDELKHLSDEVKDGLKGAMNELADDITEKILGYRTNAQGFNEDKVNEVLWGKG